MYIIDQLFLCYQLAAKADQLLAVLSSDVVHQLGNVACYRAGTLYSATYY